jgi:hypothetical protein
VLYYAAPDKLDHVVTKIVKSVRPGVDLLTTHRYVISDHRDRTALDWDDDLYGAIS